MLITWLSIVWQCSSPYFSGEDNEEASAQEASKKDKKKKAHDVNKSESQAATGLGESDSKQPLQTRTFANGMIIQEVEMGKPDGKKATRGKKVNISGIWGTSKGWSPPSYHLLLQFLTASCNSNIYMLFRWPGCIFLHGYSILLLEALLSDALNNAFFFIRFLLDILAS